MMYLIQFSNKNISTWLTNHFEYFTSPLGRLIGITFNQLNTLIRLRDIILEVVTVEDIKSGDNHM